MKINGKKYELDSNYSICIISTMNQFLLLRNEWDKLLENRCADVPFLCFDWFKIWLDHFLMDGKLFVLSLYKQGQLIAIAPLIIRNERYKGLIKVNKICTIGNVHSPVQNFLYSHLSYFEKKEASSQFIYFLKNYFKLWDIIELEAIPEKNNDYMAIYEALSRYKFHHRKFFCFADWYMDNINFSGNDYIQKLSKKVRHELIRRKKRLCENGTIRIEIGTDKSNFERHMELYYHVRKKSWKRSEMDWRFHYETRKMAMEKGWLRCGFLFIDDNPIAAQIRIVCNNTVYFREALHDLKYNKYGPGNILRCEMIKHFLDIDEVKEIDQGRGDDPYKKKWTPKRREKKGITIFNNNLKGYVFAFLINCLLPLKEKYKILSNIQLYLTNRITSKTAIKKHI